MGVSGAYRSDRGRVVSSLTGEKIKAKADVVALFVLGVEPHVVMDPSSVISLLLWGVLWCGAETMGS